MFLFFFNGYWQQQQEWEQEQGVDFVLFLGGLAGALKLGGLRLRVGGREQLFIRARGRGGKEHHERSRRPRRRRRRKWEEKFVKSMPHRIVSINYVNVFKSYCS